MVIQDSTRWFTFRWVKLPHGSRFHIVLIPQKDKKLTTIPKYNIISRLYTRLNKSWNGWKSFHWPKILATNSSLAAAQCSCNTSRLSHSTKPFKDSRSYSGSRSHKSNFSTAAPCSVSGSMFSRRLNGLHNGTNSDNG